MKPYIIKNIDDLKIMLNEIKDKLNIYIDCEGNNLCRYGELYVIQIYYENINENVFLIDVISFKKEKIDFFRYTYNNINLEKIFLSTKITKFFYDPRNDVDSIYKEYKIVPKRVICLQLSEVAYRILKNIYNPKVNSLNKTLLKYININNEHLKIKDKIKKKMDNNNFNYKNFIITNLNINSDIIKYCCIDVLYYPLLKEKLYEKLPLKYQKWVQYNSTNRCILCYSELKIEEIKNKKRAVAPKFYLNNKINTYNEYYVKKNI